MGDYNKLIVSCTVKGVVKEELKNKVEGLGLGTSAYQSQEHIISIEENDWDHRKGDLNVIIVGQTKNGRGQNEFCEWLRPHVIQGSGENDVFAMSFSEYGDEPSIWKLGQND
jgi:hypothetical protein